MRHATSAGQGGHGMRKRKQSTFPGKLIFAATLLAMLYFFWWLLIFDHGVTAVH